MMFSRRQHDTLQLGLFDSTVQLRSADHVDRLPATAHELVEVVGLDSTIDLVRMFGGDELKIPERTDGDSRIWTALLDAVGKQAATQLVERFAGTRIYVPMCKSALLNFRNREIVQAYDAGEPFDAIRRRHRLSRSYLFRLLKKPV